MRTGITPNTDSFYTVQYKNVDSFFQRYTLSPNGNIYQHLSVLMILPFGCERKIWKNLSNKDFKRGFHVNFRRYWSIFGSLISSMFLLTGGWFLLFNHTGGKKQKLQKPDLYIKNYPRDILWRGDIGDFRKKYPFSQLRFYCRADHPNRKFHIRTLNTKSGFLVADYFATSLSTGPKACGSFERYADDNSVLANNCFHWGSHGLDGNENSAYGDGSQDTGEMLESLIYISNKERFRYNVHQKDDLCDGSDNPGNKGVWRIFVQ